MLYAENTCHIVLEHLPIPVIIVNKYCEVLCMNLSAENLFSKLGCNLNYTPSSEAKYIPHCFKQEILNFINIDLREITFEKKVNLNNEDLYFQIKSSKLNDPDDNSERITIILYDITEQKKAEISLRAREAQLASIIDALPDIYFRIDKEGTYLDCKVQSVDDLLYPPEELIGKRIEDSLPQPLGHELKSHIIKAIKTKSLVIFEYDLALSKGLQHFEARMLPFSDNEAIIVARNITKRKQTDEELLKLEKLNSIGTLAGGVAHDFNNILTIILGNISMLKTCSDYNDKCAKKLLNIEKTVFQAKNLTKQLLTFSKGSAPLKKITYIDKLIKETAVLALSGTNVMCNINLPNNLWPVEIDSGQISQIISNLVINAYQAMPNGGVIAIRAKNINLFDNEIVGLNPGKYIVISFKDQGIGIDESNLLKIFDPYFTTKKTGSGLGLTSCYSIAKKHNGHILVKSKVGKGSVFQLYLPACEGVPIEIEDMKESIFHGENKILVMDDEPEIRKIIESMLKHLGYRVALSKDGVEAIELYDSALKCNAPFDAVIMDLTIPGGMGGEEAIRHLLKIDPTIKAVVSSGYSDSSVLANYKEYGFKGVINKPYTIEELSRELNKVLSSCG